MKNNRSRFKRISIEKAKSLINNNPDITIADIRDENSYDKQNIPNSIHISSKTIDKFLKDTKKENPLLIYCYHGNSSLDAADYFEKQGFKQVYSMDGGFSEYKKLNSAD